LVQEDHSNAVVGENKPSKASLMDSFLVDLLEHQRKEATGFLSDGVTPVVTNGISTGGQYLIGLLQICQVRF